VSTTIALAEAFGLRTDLSLPHAEREAELRQRVDDCMRRELGGTPDPWRHLREVLIQDVADYREAAAGYARSKDDDGRRRALAKGVATSKVLTYMDELERQR
jgi:hypothetical protein